MFTQRAIYRYGSVVKKTSYVLIAGVIGITAISTFSRMQEKSRAATCSGYTVNISAPATNLASTVAAEPAGTCFYLTNGNYDFHNVVPKDGMKFYGQSRTGVIVDGTGHENAFHGTADSVEIRDMSFHSFDDLGVDGSGNPATGNPQEQAPIRGTNAIWDSNAGSLATNWTIDNVESYGNIAAGIFLGDNFTVSNSIFRDNNVTGLGGDEFVGGIIIGNQVYNNGFFGSDGSGANGGAMKFTQASDYSNRLQIINNTVTNNKRGIWLDVAVHGVDITGNTVSGQESFGIGVEVSDDVVISDNTLTNNASTWSNMTANFSTGGILSAESKDVTIQNNSVDGSRSAITVRQTHRPHDAFETTYFGGIPDITLVSENVQVINNQISNALEIGVANAGSGLGELNASSNIDFLCNTYDNTSGMTFYWIDNTQQTFAQWQADGRDVPCAPNNTPTDITLSSAAIDENVPANSVVGTLSTTDADSGDTHTYSLVAGLGDVDNAAFNISGSNLRITNSPDYETQSSYSVRIQTDDGNGGTYAESFIISINDLNDTDTTPPTITLTGANPQTIQVGGSYTELGATANDDVDGDISGSIVINSSAVNTSVLGSYSVTYDVADTAGNNATQVTRTVDVVDTTPPTISLLGTNPQTVTQGNAYIEAGATATDNYDGDVSGSIVINSSAVDTNTIGSYTVTYNAADSSSNNATQVNRTVDVVAPSGNNNPTDITLSASSIDENVAAASTVGTLSATDADSGDTHTFGFITGTGDTDNAAFTIAGTTLSINGSPDFETKNSYSVRIQTDDGNGGTFAKALTITINDLNTAPTGINLSSLTITDTATGPGAAVATLSAVDDGEDTTPTFSLVTGLGDGDNASFQVSGTTLQTAGALTAGDYVIRLGVDDGALNYSNGFIITVTATDTTPPTITYTGANPIILTQGDSYIPPAVTANDDVDGNITGSIVQSGDTVDTNTVGTYHRYYDVQDSSGNSATQLHITVNVVAPPTGDGDGVDDAIEDAGPNGGDANGDATADSAQANVASIVNGNTSGGTNYATLEASAAATITQLQSITEASLSTQDTDYDYPIGLFDFTVSTTNGATETVTIYLDQLYDTTDWVWRKYINNAFTTIPVTFGTQTIGSNDITTVTYDITDGGTNDADSAANGIIVDPAGPAVLAVSSDSGNLASTGATILYATLAGGAIITIATGLPRSRGWRR